MSHFKGFSKESLGFLRDVKQNNNKIWFEENRSIYEEKLLTPFRKLVTELAPVIQSIDPDMEVRPSINRTISKIFRDVRFSKDKSFFRDAMWLVFKRPGKDWSTSIPGYYFEITPERYRYGMGYYSAAPRLMAAFREKIDAKPQAFSDAVSFMQADGRYTLEGESYKRKISNEHPEEINAWYQMKTFYLAHNRTPDDLLFSEDLVGMLIEGFLQAKSLYVFLRDINIS